MVVFIMECAAIQNFESTNIWAKVHVNHTKHHEHVMKKAELWDNRKLANRIDWTTQAWDIYNTKARKSECQMEWTAQVWDI